MDRPPFVAEVQLYSKLCITSDRRSVRRRRDLTRANPPIQDGAEKQYLPGQPRIILNEPNIGQYLQSEFATDALDKLSPHLWLIATPDSSHISSLTHQLVKGRRIIITEKPELHLIWIYERVFIKPIPKYLLSHAFWDFYLTGQDSPIPEPQRQDIARAALGFLRSYSYLIRHKSDFILATDDQHRLLPKDISYSAFVKFIAAFESVDDGSVSPRYNFGELRLTRLNFWTKIFLGRFTYFKVYGQYGAYFARFYAPILFAFGIFSVWLSAMQVTLAVQPLVQSGDSWTAFAHVSRGFSLFTIVFVVLIALFFLCTAAILSLREFIFALRHLVRKHKHKTRADVEGNVSTK